MESDRACGAPFLSWKQGMCTYLTDYPRRLHWPNKPEVGTDVGGILTNRHPLPRWEGNHGSIPRLWLRAVLWGPGLGSLA